MILNNLIKIPIILFVLLESIGFYESLTCVRSFEILVENLQYIQIGNVNKMLYTNYNWRVVS